MPDQRVTCGPAGQMIRVIRSHFERRRGGRRAVGLHVQTGGRAEAHPRSKELQ